mmetsp:Transcript_4839/g.9619  ORF Transcript_4839/g.9619 Transcript_4839/m.9619 type:complete len:103 (-) Transcript_4839:1715-2023(-)
MRIKIVPSAASLIRRELLKNKDTKYPKKNITYKQLVKISKSLIPRSYSRDFEGTIKQVLGTCASMKVSIDCIKAKYYLKKVMQIDRINAKKDRKKSVKFVYR